jgi:hypothetical protein
MKIGTKSVLFGAHQFILHPLLLIVGWWQEYGASRVLIGYRMVWEEVRLNKRESLRRLVQRSVRASIWDPRLWVAFIVHDLGYLGKPNMDGPEGETHPEFGAAVMRRLFGEPWGEFVLTHSRYYAKRLNRPVSPLCMADKRVIIIEPWWLYLPRVWATGELAEFMAVAQRRATAPIEPGDPLTFHERSAMASGNARAWNRAVRSYMRRWIAEHKSGKPDTWTRSRNAAA